MAKQADINSVRHSLSHVMAAAVQKLHPNAKFGVGPVVENGFYYDIVAEHTFGPEDLKAIQSQMKKLIGQKLDFVREDWPIDEAIKYFKDQNQDFKVELLHDLKTKGSTAVSDAGDEELIEQSDAKVTTVSMYKTGDFTDLCRGPHVKNTSEIPVDGYKLTKVSGAYWRGNENNPQMQRIYGVAFENKADLDKYLKMLEEAEKRDHRKLGKQLDLYTISHLVGSGLPLFTPKGAILRDKLAEFSQELQAEFGFERVWTPHMARIELYKTSGHYDKFPERFEVTSAESSDVFMMKPMNCPHHIQLFARKPWSYKELPVRYMENTTNYRDEKHGELHGLSRVRSLSQDDGHIFCTEEQIEAELSALVSMVKRLYTALGMEFYARLSYRDDSDAYLGDKKLWAQAESVIAKVAKEQDLESVDEPGEAAFYGPKIDFMVKDSLGREWQCATAQLDFVQPERFGLMYVDESGNKVQPIMLHKALLGSIERFLSVYIEHTAGAFPLWLAPEQVRVLPVSEKFAKYAEKVSIKLMGAGMRVETDDSGESLGKRIRNAEVMKVPYVLIVGEKEAKDNTVAVRKYGKGDLGAKSIDELITTLTKTTRDRSLD